MSLKLVQLFSLILVLLLSPDAAFSTPEPLAALFQKKQKVEPMSDDYRTYFKAKDLVEKKEVALSVIEETQRELLLAPFNAPVRTLEKEFEDLFYALEIQKGIGLVKQRRWNEALNAFDRGISNLSQFKWIYYWRLNASHALAKLILRKKNKFDPDGVLLATRIVEAFPKVALETEPLRELEIPESIPSAELGSERLSQSYTEKIEKDEEGFKAILDFYLNGKSDEVIDHGKAWLEAFPRSSLRFRVNFLMAESYLKNKKEKEAQSLYLMIMEQSPLSYYAIVSSERAQVSLKERVKKDAMKVDLDELNFNTKERKMEARVKTLIAKKKAFDAAAEFEGFNRLRNYNTDTLLYLVRLMTEANQHLYAFRVVNELIQRKYDSLLSRELIDLIFPDTFLKEVKAVAEPFALDPLVVLGLMKQESGFRAPILSSSGAMGLMQLMPFTAIDVKKDLMLSTLKDPKVNIEVGTQYFKSLVDRFEGNIPYALASYNAGPHRVAKWNKDIKTNWGILEWIEAIPFKETRDYVMSILRNRYWYQFRHSLPDSKITEMKLTNKP